MRALFALAIVPLLFIAGCVTKDEPTTPPPPPPPPQPYYTLDCTIAPGMGNATWFALEPCLAMASPNDSPSKTEIDMAVNPTNPLNIVVASKDKDPKASNGCVWSVAQVTKDGGKTWKTVYVGGDRENREPETTGYECVTDPIMVFDAKGVFYYALQIYDHSPRGNPGGQVPDTGSAFILARSKDGGLTFDHYAVQAEGAGDFVFHDYPRMIVNPKTQSILAIWNAYITPLPLNVPVGTYAVAPVVSVSRDGGETVDPPLVLHSEDSPQALAFFSGFAATKEGVIYVTMQKAENSDAGDATNVWIWKSIDDGRSFSEVGKAFQIKPTPRQYNDTGHKFRTPSFVEMAIDASTGNHSGRIYTFWPEWSNGQSDIMMSYSDDASAWSAPVNIAKDPQKDQLFMRPVVDRNGTVHVLFATTAYSGSDSMDQVHAWSRDGGLTWENQRLTRTSFNGDLGIHQENFPFIGDYNGIVAGPDGVIHAAWGDTAAGRAEILYAKIVRS